MRPTANSQRPTANGQAPTANGRRSLISIATLLTLAACIEAPAPTRQLVAGGDAERGARLVAVYGCGSCHDIPGVPGARGAVGPSLHRFGERAYIAGALRNEPRTLVRWIRFPQSVQPGTAMPDMGVTDAHARDIAAFLYTLDDGGLGPPHLWPAKVLGH